MNQATQKQITVKSLIDSPSFLSSVSLRMNQDNAKATKFVKMLQTAVNRTPDLLKCSPSSLTIAAYQLAELNLSPIPQHGHAYLIPYKNKQTNETECQFQLGYRGLATLAMRDGGVRSIHAEIAYKGDTLICSQGLNPNLIHELNFDCQRDDKNINVVYAVAHLADGSKVFEIMSKGQIDEIKNQHSQAVRGGRRSPWDSAYGEMAKKTVIKRLAKMLPMCEALDLAINVDNTATGYEERDITSESEVVDDIKNRIASRKKTNDYIEPEDYEYSDVPEDTAPTEMAQMFKNEDYKVNVLKSVDLALAKNIMSPKAIETFCNDRNASTPAELKAEDALFLINDINKKLEKTN